jgi:hypothetical protein
MTVAQLKRAVAALRREGSEIIATDLEKLPPTKREIELLHDGDEVDELRQLAEAACAAALGRSHPSVKPRAVAVSFISHGRSEDAMGIIRAFGLERHVEEIRFVEEDVAVVVISGEALQCSASETLQTALEAALNREVRLSASPLDLP